jgi:hypothetical protein
MLELWTGLPSAERERVEALEEFDEHEEWAEKCSHYVLVTASTTEPLSSGVSAAQPSNSTRDARAPQLMVSQCHALFCVHTTKTKTSNSTLVHSGKQQDRGAARWTSAELLKGAGRMADCKVNSVLFILRPISSSNTSPLFVQLSRLLYPFFLCHLLPLCASSSEWSRIVVGPLRCGSWTVGSGVRRLRRGTQPSAPERAAERGRR